MPSFGVTPEKEKALLERMNACGLREQDIKESFVSSGGPGGQKVNRTASCVLLVHEPTGTSVKTQQVRSQALNRFYARRRLCELLEEKILGTESPKSLQRSKIKKQKARRQRRSSSAHGS